MPHDKHTTHDNAPKSVSMTFCHYSHTDCGLFRVWTQPYPFSVQITVFWSDWEDCFEIGVKEWIELETHKFIFIGSQAIVTRLPSLHGKCSNSIIPLCRSRNISKLTLLLLKHQKNPPLPLLNT